MKIIKTSKYKDKIEGGKADKKVPSDFSKKEIEKGVTVEMEHTSDPEIAKEIVMDHLKEHKDYYIGLKHMENCLTEIENKNKKDKK